MNNENISKKFLSRLIELVLEKISYRTISVDNGLMSISGPNKVQIKNSGNSQPGIYVDSNDYVGINTSVPLYNLDVAGSTRINGNLYVVGSTYSIDTLTEYTDALNVTNTGTDSCIVVNQKGNFPLISFQYNDVPHSIITNFGYFGLGTITPLDLLDVRGYIRSSLGYKLNDVTLIDTNANATFAGSLDISKNFTINNTIFTVDSTSGNTYINGNLNLNKNLYLNTNKFTIDTSGNTFIAGSLNINNLMTVDASGNTTIYGKLNLNDTININQNGNTTINGTLTSLDNFSVNNVLTTNATSGNTVIAGTLNLGNTFNLNNNFIVDPSGNFTANGILALGNNLSINTDKFTVNSNTGNTSIAGTLSVNDNINLLNKFTVDTSGNTLLNGTLSIGNNLNLLNVLSVDTLGNTFIAGQTSISKNLYINVDAFTVDVNSGFATIRNKLSIGRQLNVPNINNLIILGENKSSIFTDVDISGNLNLPNLSVDISGNTNINGTLDVSNNTMLHGNLEVGGNLHLDGSFSISQTFVVSQNTTMNADLDVYGDVTMYNNLFLAKNIISGTTFIVDNSANFIGVNNVSPKYNLDISGNTYTTSLNIRNNTGTNGILFSMPDLYDPSFFFNSYTTNNAAFLYDTESMIIALSDPLYPNTNSIIEFNTFDYIGDVILNTFKFSFSYKLTNGTGNGISVSFYNKQNYASIAYDANNFGYTFFLNFSNNSIEYYNNGLYVPITVLQNLTDISYDVFHIIDLIVDTNNNITLNIDNITYLQFQDNTIITGNYFAIGGWSDSNGLSIYINDVSLYVEYDKSVHKLQVFGDTLLNELIVNGPITCQGNLLIDGKLFSNNSIIDISNNTAFNNDIIIDGNLYTTGDIIKMPTSNNLNNSFKFNKYIVGNDYNFDYENMIITLTNNSIGSNQSIIELDLSNYISSLLNETTVSFDFAVGGTGGYGFWVFVYNTLISTITVPGYSQNFGGFNIFFDFFHNVISVYYGGSLIRTINVDIRQFMSNNQTYHNLSINCIIDPYITEINISIDGILYSTQKYNIIITDGKYFGLGGISGSSSLQQLIKNININGSYINTENKLAIFGTTLLKGDTNISGLLNTNDIIVDGSFIVKDNIYINKNQVGINMQPNYNLDVSGNVNFTGNLYRNGILFDKTVPWVLADNSVSNYYTIGNVGIQNPNPQYTLDISGNLNCTDIYANSLTINNNLIINNIGVIVNTSSIPALSASKITSGVFDQLRIPFLDASRINSGTFPLSQIPNLPASKITSGVINNNFLPFSRGSTSIGASTTGSIVVSISNPFNSDTVIVTGNCKAIFNGVQTSRRYIVEIGNINIDTINFIISTANGTAWTSTENILHYVIFS